MPLVGDKAAVPLCGGPTLPNTDWGVYVYAKSPITNLVKQAARWGCGRFC